MRAFCWSRARRTLAPNGQKLLLVSQFGVPPTQFTHAPPAAPARVYTAPRISGSGGGTAASAGRGGQAGDDGQRRHTPPARPCFFDRQASTFELTIHTPTTRPQFCNTTPHGRNLTKIEALQSKLLPPQATQEGKSDHDDHSGKNRVGACLLVPTPPPNQPREAPKASCHG